MKSSKQSLLASASSFTLNTAAPVLNQSTGALPTRQRTHTNLHRALLVLEQTCAPTISSCRKSFTVCKWSTSHSRPPCSHRARHKAIMKQRQQVWVIHHSDLGQYSWTNSPGKMNQPASVFPRWFLLPPLRQGARDPLP